MYLNKLLQLLDIPYFKIVYLQLQRHFNMRMKLSDFNYELPKELVAEYPNKNRDEARLMVIDRKDYSIKHRQFKDMIEYFDENDVIILNNTKVFPARLFGNKEKTGARIEVFLLRELNLSLIHI